MRHLARLATADLAVTIWLVTTVAFLAVIWLFAGIDPITFATALAATLAQVAGHAWAALAGAR